MKNILISVGIVVGIIALTGAYIFPQSQIITNNVAGSPVGSTFTTAKIAAINFTPATAAATSTSILNTDASDRYITSNFVECANASTSFTAYTGAGLAAFIVSAATTSTNAPAVIANTNLAMLDTVATGTGNPGAAGYNTIMVSSSSIATATAPIFNNLGVSPSFRWAAGSYLTFFSNATNTMSCTVGVHYIGS